VDDGDDALYPMGQKRDFLEDSDATAKVKCFEGENCFYGRHMGKGAPSLGGGSKKGGDQALGLGASGQPKRIQVRF